VKTFTFIVLASCLLSPAVMADSCRYSRDINFEVAADELARLDIEVGAGYLHINSDTGSNSVSVRATACADSERRLDEIDLTQTRRGNTLAITSEIGDDWLSFNLFSANYAYLNVDISVPAGLQIDIDDGSGEITITHVLGDIRINDGSGEIRIEDLTGSVRLQDGSGDIYLNRISGSVQVLDDGSGDIRIETVGGNVSIDDDGSGDISVREVTGDFETGDTGSGDVNYSAVEGRVDIR
jgi:DUF4097 and DUF4098 domain-containing protein YvlB